jgi:hypothetical protein
LFYNIFVFLLYSKAELFLSKKGQVNNNSGSHSFVLNVVMFATLKTAKEHAEAVRHEQVISYALGGQNWILPKEQMQTGSSETLIG